jgi:hypothetical protein
MSYTYSLIAITPASFKETAEALGMAMGHSGNEFNVALGNPTTHYALHAWTTPETAAVWLGQAYPADTGYTPEQIDAVRSQLIISCIEGADPLAHFNEVLAANNLDRSGE